MRVAVLHSFYASGTPSGENIVVDLQVEALKRAGHEVELVAARTDDFSHSKGYRYKTALNVATGSGIDPTNRLRVIAPDVVHVHNLFPNFSTKWLKSWPGPIVSTVHNFRSVCAAATLFREGEGCKLCPEKGQYHAVIHKCYRGSAVATVPLAIRNAGGVSRDPVLSRTDATIFLSARSRDEFRGFGLDDASQFVVPNFVLPVKHPTVSAVGSRWIYLGRMTKEKGIEQLLSVWPSSHGLDIYGDGPDSKLIESLASGNVRFHGPKNRGEALKALSSAAGLVIPSIWAEGLPTTYLEALSAGVPVLAKAGNSAADDIAMYGTGRVFDDWAEVPQLVEEVRASREIYSAVSVKRFHEGFAEQKWVSAVEEVYAEAMQNCALRRERKGN